jgi:hypothetical protein
VPLPAPNSTFSDDLYRFHWPELGVECLLERFSERKDDIAAELTVNVDDPLRGGRLYSGRLLLIGPNSRRDVQRNLEERIDIDWAGVLEQLCLLARDRYRKGEPPVDLSQVEYQEQAHFLLAPFVVRKGITIPYGDGGTAKSLLTLHWCVRLALEGIKSLYLDWEDDAATHAERLYAICAGMEIDVPQEMIFYQHRSVPLASSVREVRRFIAEKGVEHSVVDSVGMAAGDPNDHGLMIEAVRAARSLDVAATLVHHLPKDARDKTKPFGSVYASNEARITWLVEKAQEEETDELAIALTNHKYNRGRLQGKRAYRLRFINDRDTLLSVSFDETEVGQVSAFRSKLPQRRLIADALKSNGPLSVGHIQSCLEIEGVVVTADHVRAVLSRYRDLFAKRGDTWILLSDRVEPQHVS